MSREKLFSVTLADCDVSTFRASGPGGQHRNTSDTAVRIRHRASGAVAEAKDSRSQHQNKRAAWDRMIKTGAFRMWLAQQVMTQGRDLEAEVRRQTQPHLLRVEICQDGKWQLTG